MKYFLLFLCLFFAACSPSPAPRSFEMGTLPDSALYALQGQEVQVEFEAVFQTRYHEIESLPRGQFWGPLIHETTTYLFGPLTFRSLGGIQKGEKISPLYEKAFLKNGRVMLPYKYSATWMLHKKTVDAGKEIKLPLPFSADSLNATDWRNCTDKHPDHATLDFLWYYWDPSRWGCLNVLDQDYQEVVVRWQAVTPQTTLSFPEYKRLIRMENGRPVLAMTFAFGYVEETDTPDPLKDRDEGMRQFRGFLGRVEKTLKPLGFRKFDIHQADYEVLGTTVIGHRFEGEKNGVLVRVSVVAAAGVDQMELFAQSFSRFHEGFFGWFGHSRVGSGFDADRFRSKLINYPWFYSMTQDYQLVFWNGCNSYSYYTMPFFDLKSQLDPQRDPKGTLNLDLISNTLPTYFHFNVYNAEVLFKALFNFEAPTSYQSIVNDLENYANRNGTDVIVNVLGDEDNQAF